MAIIGLTYKALVGVDVERIRTNVKFDLFLDRYFTHREIDALKKTASNKLSEAFFSCWTCKEAFTKAIGQGLTYPLNEIDLSIFFDKTKYMLNNNVHETQQWSLATFTPLAGYVGAVVVKGKLKSLKYWKLA